MSSSHLRAQGETLASDALAPLADLVAPAAKVALAPPRVAVPPPRLDPPGQPNPDQELREIVALRDPRQAPPPLDAAASPSAQEERSAIAPPPAATAVDGSVVSSRPADRSDRPVSATPPGPDAGGSDRRSATADRADGMRAAVPQPAPASASLPVFETGAAPVAAASPPSAGSATASLAAPVRVAPPETSAPQAESSPAGSVVEDPVAIASTLRAAPMTPGDQVEVLEMVGRLAIVLRDVRAENAALKARMQSSMDRVDSTLADFARRLALAEARGALDAAMGVSTDAAARPLAVAASEAAPAERQSRPAPPVSRAVPVSASSAPVAAPSSAAAPAPRYHVAAASPGLAMLSVLDRGGGAGSQLQVSLGDRVPGFGKIVAILQRGSTWIVQTDNGVIQ
jgi:hypothetical protein